MRHGHMVVLLGLVAPLAAQQPMPIKPDSMRPGMMGHPGMMQGPGMQGPMRQGPMMGHMKQMHEMMGPMMRGMAFTPEHLLARKEALGLTAQQEARLTALRDAAKTAHDAAAADAKTHVDAVAQAFKAGAPDTSALKQHFQAAHAAMGKAHWTMLAAAAQAKAVLTAEQRGRVDGWVDAMQMHQMMQMQPMRPHPPNQPPR